MHSDAFRVYTVLVNQVSLANFGYENLLLHWGEKKRSLRVVEIRSCHSFPDVSQKSWTGGWRRVGLMVGSWSHGGSNGGNNWRIAMVRSNLEHALFEEVSLAEVAHFQILAFSCCFSCYVCSVLWLTWSLSFFFFITGAVFGALLARRGFVARAWGPEFFECSLLGVFSVCFYKNQVSLFLKDALQLNAAIFRVLQPRSP